MSVTKLMTGSLILLTALGTTACGSHSAQKLITYGGIEMVTQNTSAKPNITGKVHFQLNGEKLPLFPISIPVMKKLDDDSGQSEQLGAVTIQSDLSSNESVLTLEVNLTEILKLDQTKYAFVDKLPNDQPLPVTVPDTALKISLPLGGYHGRVYLALGNQVSMAGIAIAIKEFQKVGANVGDLTAFTRFQIGTELKGVAGLFTNSDPLKNGIAIFADVSSGISKFKVAQASLETAAAQNAQDGQGEKIELKPVHPDAEKAKALNNEMNEIQKALKEKKTSLSVTPAQERP